MAAYRILQIEELEIFQSEFIQFLSSQSITADDWKKWQNQNPDKVKETIDRFSEFVFFTIFEKSDFFEKRVHGGVHYIKFSGHNMFFIAIEYPEQFNEGNLIDLSLCTVTQGKKKSRESVHDEKFDLVKQGFFPVKSSLEEQVEGLFLQIFEA